MCALDLMDLTETHLKVVLIRVFCDWTGSVLLWMCVND